MINPLHRYPKPLAARLAFACLALLYLWGVDATRPVCAQQTVASEHAQFALALPDPESGALLQRLALLERLGELDQEEATATAREAPVQEAPARAETDNAAAESTAAASPAMPAVATANLSTPSAAAVPQAARFASERATLEQEIQAMEQMVKLMEMKEEVIAARAQFARLLGELERKVDKRETE